MWLFKGTKDKCSETVIYSNEDKIKIADNFPSVNNKTKNVDTIEALKERVEYVKRVTSRLEIFTEKQNKNNISSNTVKTICENHLIDDRENINDVNNSKIDDILKLIPKLENNMKTLCKKVNNKCAYRNKYFLIIWHYFRYHKYLKNLKDQNSVKK